MMIKIIKKHSILVLSFLLSSVTHAQDMQWLDNVLHNATQIESVETGSLNAPHIYGNDEALITLEPNEDFNSYQGEQIDSNNSGVLNGFFNTESEDASAEYQQDAVEQSDVIEIEVDRPELISKNIEVTNINGYAYFEGDIVLGEIDKQQKSVVGMGMFHRRWTNGVVPYLFDSSLSGTKIKEIKAAIKHWQLHTPVGLVARSSGQANYILFRKSRTGGCSSYVGMKGGQQEIDVADWCKTGSIIHEIGHAIGLWHEQSREDRDQYITINFANITRQNRHNFKRQVRNGNDVGKYDYNSIMHYSSHAFSANEEATIIPKKADVRIGQRKKLSAGDIAGINKMYPLASQQASCTSNTQYRSPECATAIQQACSSPLRGGAGVSQEVGDDFLSVACLKPTWQGSVGGNKLQSYNRLCSDVNTSQKTACYAAARLYCEQEHQLSAGLIQGVQRQSINVACFTPKWRGAVSFITLKKHFQRCTGIDKVEKSGCVAAVHRYCLNKHQANAGIIQGASEKDLTIACFVPTVYSNMPLTSDVAYAVPQAKPSNNQHRQNKPNADVDEILQLFN